MGTSIGNSTYSSLLLSLTLKVIWPSTVIGQKIFQRAKHENACIQYEYNVQVSEQERTSYYSYKH